VQRSGIEESLRSFDFAQDDRNRVDTVVSSLT